MSALNKCAARRRKSKQILSEALECRTLLSTSGLPVYLIGGQTAATPVTALSVDPQLTGTIIASQTMSFTAGSGSSAVKGQVVEWVEKEKAGGTLDFYYQIHDTSGPAAGINSLAASNFYGFLGGVAYRSDSGGTIGSTSASRSTDHKTITFNFKAAPTGNGIVPPGGESHSLLISTNATSYDSAGSVALNGSIALGGYEPTSGAPANTAGKLDPTFGVGGATGAQPYSPLLNANAVFGGIGTQSDGKVIVGGFGTGDGLSLQRYAANGDLLDTTFGTGGITNSQSMQIGALAVQGNNDIVVAGGPSGGGSNIQTAVIVQRYTANGALDTSFGTNGTVTTPITGGLLQVTSEAILSNGEIVVAGNYGNDFSESMVLEYTAAGKLDTTFGSGGQVIVTVGSNQFQTNAIAIRANGDITLGGNVLNTSQTPGIFGYYISAVRLHSNGALDTTFGKGGLATSPLNSAIGSSIVIQPGGDIVVAGTWDGNGGALARFTSAGKVDTTFGQGVITTKANPIKALVVESDGSLIAVAGTAVSHFSAAGVLLSTETSFGGTYASLQSSGNVLVGAITHFGRVTANAASDATFGRYGLVDETPAGFFGSETAMAVQSNGKILIGGSIPINFSSSQWEVERFNADGSIDTTFGSGGVVILAEQGDLLAMTIDSSGRILLAGTEGITGNNQQGAVIRLTAAGTLDTTFATGGVFDASIADGSDFNAIALQSNGDIVAGGYASINGVEEFALERLLPSGSIDATFGTAGVATTSILGQQDIINSIAIQKDGKIVAAGSTQTASGDTQFAVARYTTTGQFDKTFGSGGTTVIELGNNPNLDSFSQVAIDSQGRIVLSGTDLNLNAVVMRLTTAGRLDTTFASSGVYNYIAPNSDGTAFNAVTILPGDKILAGGYVATPNAPGEDAIHPKLGGFPTFTFALVQLTSAGTLDTTFATGGIYTQVGQAEPAGQVDALALQADGKIDAAANVSNNLAGIVRLTGP